MEIRCIKVTAVCDRENMNEDEKAVFWRNVEHIVEKDVVRTDRSNEYFRGDHNPNLAVLKLASQCFIPNNIQ